ncbi:MAG: carboxypeptidase-like regulatory domain-containing protein [Sphingobacteriia bacterium]|nr:MAG: carboxypeptidase-like regulatory domain-containing protein [Sphingobacteriia bacterium]
MKNLIIVLVFPLNLFSQVTFEGKVINANSKAIIPFATIGLIKENIGTNANEDGQFTLQSKGTEQNDTLTISCIGYKAQKIPTRQKSEIGLIIELTEHTKILDEVVVKTKTTWTTETLNDFSKCGNHFITTSGYQTQLAQHFEVKEENSTLTEVKICRMSNAFLYPEKTIFRIRIYDIDKITKSPSTDLCDQIIEVKTNSKVIDINLEKYKILIPSKDFFVAVEWLKIPYNESKSKIKVNGKEVDHTTYRPNIGWTNTANSKMEAWWLDYKNNWRPVTSITNKTSVSISATVKY